MIFPWFKKDPHTGEKLSYDDVMLVNANDRNKFIDGFIDHIPDEYKHNVTSSSFSIYVGTLENIYMSRFSWYSPYIPDHFLDTIERKLLSKGCCAVLREKKKVKGVTVYSDFFGVYDFTVSKFSPDGELPIQISILNKAYNGTDNTYTYPEFIIIKDFSRWDNRTFHVKPASHIINHYASKLSLIDAVIESNMNKHRLPLLVTGHMESNNKVRNYFKELYRNALYMFDGGGVDNKVKIETTDVTYIIDKLQSQKDSLMQEFCAMIGVSNSQNYSDVYQNIEQVKLNSSFVYNVAQMQYINRKKVINSKLADKIGLRFEQNKDVYGQVELVEQSINEDSTQ